MHKEGIEVSLRMTDCDAYIREHQNPASRPRRSGCYARSSLISAAPETGFAVEIKIRERIVELYDIMIVINCGPREGPIEQHSNYQAWYIPHGMKATKYEFLSFDVWDDAFLPLKEVPMALPAPDGQERLAEIQTPRAGAADRGTRNAPRRLSQRSSFSRRSRAGRNEKRSDYDDEEQPPTKRRSQRLHWNAASTDGSSKGPSPRNGQDQTDVVRPAGEDEDDEEVLRAQPKEERLETPMFPEPQSEQSSASATIEEKQQAGPVISSFPANLLVEEASVTASPSRAPSDLPSIESSSTLKTQEVSGDSDDEDDLEDELRQLEIKRKLRAMKKVQEGSGEGDDREDLEDEMRQLEIKRKLRALRKIRKARETKETT
ncbi:hypothetical protein PRZ48_003973 [Zasmidium cellare]|uniref:Uncharacterized protein n=1 Tax=Zasmidium cellare TaxID=395010 RepID=A0ABR0EY57_ZASCE|nr:hypothetical protein PRZ48_003973 [Zasmidium cellare]